ncbi:molybdenum cofactor guanylyltransferase [Salinisphaera sp. USBA-960]|nr:molybdenum cofactor guanylyltransferase [Salifodinibacter halophilus]NNC26831.1 molybdenum cofactor guanylyltransferase [Salifodinibacter halophilus]
MNSAHSHPPTAGIVAGGTGQRFGGADKGWVRVAGRPLIEHTVNRVAGQCDPILINANRNLDAYRALGFGVFPDSDINNGPLAGIETLFHASLADLLLIVPIDTPLLPTDLANRLFDALTASADLAIVRTPAGPQRMHALCRRRCLERLVAARAAGITSVGEWQADLHCAEAVFEYDTPFLNVNTPADVANVEKQLEPT